MKIVSIAVSEKKGTRKTLAAITTRRLNFGAT